MFSDMGHGQSKPAWPEDSAAEVKGGCAEAPAWREPRTRVLVGLDLAVPGALRAHSVQHCWSQGLQGLEHLKRSTAASPSGFSWRLTKSHKYKLFPTQEALAGYRWLPSALPLLPCSALLPQTQFLHSCLC